MSTGDRQHLNEVVSAAGGKTAPHLPFAVGPDFLLSALLPVQQLDAGAHLLSHPAVMHSEHLMYKTRTTIH